MLRNFLIDVKDLGGGGGVELGVWSLEFGVRGEEFGVGYKKR